VHNARGVMMSASQYMRVYNVVDDVAWRAIYVTSSPPPPLGLGAVGDSCLLAPFFGGVFWGARFSE